MKKYLIFLVTTLLLELLVFNFSSVTSMFNKQVDLTEYSYCEGVEMHIEGLDLKVSNLYIDLDPTEFLPVTFQINTTDEGDFFEYPLGEHTIALHTPSTRYINVHGYGRTHSFIFYFSEDNQPDFSKIRVYANVKRPFFFNIWRMLAVYLILCFVFALKSDGKGFSSLIETDDTPLRKKQMCITAIVMAIWIAAGYFCTSSHLLFNEESKPHHQQYKELAAALAKGQVALDYAPSEGLLAAPNPYDTIYLQANGIEYKADYAFYNGRYYVYFGIVPELILYLPYYLLTGDGFPNHAAVFLFYSAFVIGTFMLFKRMCDRYFKSVSFASYLIVSSVIVTSGPFAYLYFTADVYSVPVMAAMAFTVFGLFLWINGIEYTEKRQNGSDDRLCKQYRIVTIVSYILGSLCMSLVAGCRPQMLIFSFLAIPLFWDEVIVKRELFGKKNIGRTVALCIPYVISAAIVMWYNAARFGSVFDFGATYSLTNNDMNLRGVSLSRMLSGLWVFFFKLPLFTERFPYLHTTTFDFDWMGRVTTEHYYGGVISCCVLTWVLFLIFHFRRDIKQKKLTWIFTMILTGSVIIAMLDSDRAGVLQRYASESSFGIFVGTGFMLLLVMDVIMMRKKSAGDDTENSSSRAYDLAVGLLKAGAMLSLAFTFMIICNTDSGITLIKYNPELFYKIASMFSF